MEPIDLVNSVIIFLSQMALLRLLTFPLKSLTVTLKGLLFWIHLFLLDASICSTMVFPPLGNSDHVVVSISTDFLSNSTRDAPFHRIAYEYSGADWDGLHDHLGDISLTVSIRSGLTHLHDFQLLVLLP